MAKSIELNSIQGYRKYVCKGRKPAGILKDPNSLRESKKITLIVGALKREKNLPCTSGCTYGTLWSHGKVEFNL